MTLARLRPFLRLALLVAALATLATAPGCAAPPPPQRLAFQSNGRTLTMAYWPAKTPDGTPAPGRHPAILLLHGGGGPELIENDPNYRQYPDALAAAGYTVYMPYYWGSTEGQKLSDEQATALWVSTARNALAWINAQPDVIPGRIGCIGLSSGAHLGLLLAAQDPGLKVLVSFYGWLSDTEAARLRRMPPTLILHGEKDVLVDVEEARRLDRLFAARNIPHAIHLYPDQNHGFMNAAGPDSVRRMLAFLNSHM